MPDMHHYWTGTNVFQASEETLQWDWVVGENEHYWGYSIRPYQLNSAVEVLRQWTTSDNDFHWTEHFLVNTPGPNAGGLIRFSAISAVGS